FSLCLRVVFSCCSGDTHGRDSFPTRRSSDLSGAPVEARFAAALDNYLTTVIDNGLGASTFAARVIISTLAPLAAAVEGAYGCFIDRKSTRLNSSHVAITYAGFCLQIKNIYLI